MNNIYVEYCFEKEITLTRKLFQAFLIGIAVILGFDMMFVPILVPVWFAATACAFLYHRSLKCEYEYIMLDDDLSIDRIINKERRRKMARIDLGYLVDFSTVDEDFYKRYEGVSMKTKKYYSRINEDNIYAIILSKGNQYKCIYIQADENLVKAISARHPRNLHL